MNNPLEDDEPTGTPAFFRANTAADQKIADLAALRARLDAPDAVPEWQPIAAGIATLVDRYYSEAADCSQESAITNLASLMRHASGFAGALCHEVQHYAQDAADARDTARTAQGDLVDALTRNAVLRLALEGAGIAVPE